MLRKIKDWIKVHPHVKRICLWALRVSRPVYHPANLSFIPKYMFFLVDWLKFRHAGGKAAVLDFYPYLFDKTTTTGIDHHYFYQAIWAFKKILAHKPNSHVDVGSDVKYVGMLTAIADVTFIDIRPLKLPLDKYTGKEGSILAIPFNDNSISSLSSLHVIEHIGLGRYGDPIDPEGTGKACKELKRVLAPGGRLYISTPIGRPRVQFNGQRVFDIKDILTFFDGLKLIELSIVDALGNYRENVNPDTVEIFENIGLDFGLGMFMFESP